MRYADEQLVYLWSSIRRVSSNIFVKMKHYAEEPTKSQYHERLHQDLRSSSFTAASFTVASLSASRGRARSFLWPTTPTPRRNTNAMSAPAQRARQPHAHATQQQKHAPNAPNANPVHIASLYATSWSSRDTSVPDGSLPPAFAICVLNTTVEIARPNAVPIWVTVWKTAPPSDCSWGRQTLAVKSVPVANTKSAPNTVRIAAGKPKAQYGAAGLISARRRPATAVDTHPNADRSRFKF